MEKRERCVEGETKQSRVLSSCPINLPSLLLHSPHLVCISQWLPASLRPRPLLAQPLQNHHCIPHLIWVSSKGTLSQCQRVLRNQVPSHRREESSAPPPAYPGTYAYGLILNPRSYRDSPTCTPPYLFLLFQKVLLTDTPNLQ